MPNVKKRQKRNGQLHNSQFNKTPNATKCLMLKKLPRLITKLPIQQNVPSHKTPNETKRSITKTPNETKRPN